VNVKVKAIEDEKRELESKLLAAMDDVGTTVAKGKKASVSISETSRFSISDFEQLAPFLLRKKALHLFERRISSTAAKEMIESLGGKPIPGVAEFKQRRLNVR
jgi:hypothetical protein